MVMTLDSVSMGVLKWAIIFISLYFHCVHHQRPQNIKTFNSPMHPETFNLKHEINISICNYGYEYNQSTLKGRCIYSVQYGASS